MIHWYQEANFYHLYPLGLCGAEAINDYRFPQNRLREIHKWIGHIKEIGCNAVYFGPIFQSHSHGYDTTDYYRIDSRIGDDESFGQLVRALRENGLRIVLDGVFNHCGKDFFAFRDVLEKGRASDYCDWFHLDFEDRAGDNFLACPAQSGTGFCYDTWNRHPELVRFNLQNPQVKAYLLDVVRYWTKNFLIDGWRLDCADRLDFNFLKELRQTTEQLSSEVWLMGEVVHGDYSRWANPLMLHSVTNYEAYKGLYSSHNDVNLFEIAYSLNREFNSQTGLYNGLWLYNFVDNHDQNRLASTVSDIRYLYTIYLLLYTIPGIPSLYYGSEWGIKGVKSSCSDAGLRPPLDIGSRDGRDMDLQSAIQRFSHIRNRCDALSQGTYRQIFVTHTTFAFERKTKKETVIVLINTASHGQRAQLDDNGPYTDLLNDEEIYSRNVWLYPHWGRILLTTPQ